MIGRSGANLRMGSGRIGAEHAQALLDQGVWRVDGGIREPWKGTDHNGVPEVAREKNGGGGIRTPETVSRLTVFKTVAFSHSATPPRRAGQTPVSAGRPRRTAASD